MTEKIIRVLRYDGVGLSSFPTLNVSASGVFGQPDFFTFSAGVGPNKMSGPTYLYASGLDGLYVSDSNNARVVCSFSFFAFFCFTCFAFLFFSLFKFKIHNVVVFPCKSVELSNWSNGFLCIWANEFNVQ